MEQQSHTQEKYLRKTPETGDQHSKEIRVQHSKEIIDDIENREGGFLDTLSKESEKYQEKYQEYVKKREKGGKEIFTLEEMRQNSTNISDKERFDKIRTIVDYHENINTNQKKDITNMLMTMHKEHQDMGIDLFELGAHPEILKKDINKLIETYPNIDRKIICHIYREGVDSGLLGSIEQSEQLKKIIKKLGNADYWAGQIPAVALLVTLATILHQHGFDTKQLTDAAMTGGSSFLIKNASAITQTLIIAMAAGKISKFTIHGIINNRKRKLNTLDDHIKKTKFISEEIQKHQKEKNPFLSSFELLDQIFSDEEIENFYRLLREKSSNATDVDKIQYMLKHKDIAINENQIITSNLNEIDEHIDNIPEVINKEIDKRIRNMSEEDLYIIFYDIFDNFNHIKTTERQREEILKEVEKVIKKPAQLKVLKDKIYHLI